MLCWGLPIAITYVSGALLQASEAVGFVPTSVISGFLSCIGYKVVKLAVFVGTTHKLKFKYVSKLVKAYDDKV